MDEDSQQDQSYLHSVEQHASIDQTDDEVTWSGDFLETEPQKSRENFLNMMQFDELEKVEQMLCGQQSLHVNDVEKQ